MTGVVHTTGVRRSDSTAPCTPRPRRGSKRHRRERGPTHTMARREGGEHCGRVGRFDATTSMVYSCCDLARARERVGDFDETISIVLFKP